VVRGGAWNNNRDNAACSYRNNDNPHNRNNNIGFRCAKTPLPSAVRGGGGRKTVLLRRAAARHGDVQTTGPGPARLRAGRRGLRLAAGRNSGWPPGGLWELLMDFQTLKFSYDALPTAAKAVCAKVGTAVLGKVLGGTLNAAEQKMRGAAFAGIYRQWREDLLEAEADDEKLAAAFGEFFSRKPTIRELDKLLHDQYGQVDFHVLEEQLCESCQWAKCPVPRSDLHEALYGWVRDLRTLLEDSPEYRDRFQLPLQNAIRELGQYEAVIGNDSVALKQYLASVVKQHRYVRFAGMAEVSGPDEVEMSRVFVMPRLVERIESGGREAKPAAAFTLLAGKKAPRRLVILGGPGSGKTTLLESFCLALAQGNTASFSWARGLPSLVPVFYRIRDLERDLETHRTIWDAIRHDCSRKMGLNLPPDFFLRQMERGPLMLLFDGLDEAATQARRNEMVALIETFVDNLSPESRVIITSRPHDYRRRFEAAAYRHYELCEFDDAEIQTFVQGWRAVHEPDRAAAVDKGEALWKALQARKDILPLARNALLLTMIVRVHFGLGALPDSRLMLYEKCSETLLKHWASAKDLPASPIDFYQKRKFLSQLAFDMQGESGEQLAEGLALQIRRTELERRLERFLREKGAADTLNLVETIVDRLHARDAILVQYGGDQFGFVHRSFQEYFAAVWMAGELADADFQARLAAEPAGWNETLYLAVAQLKDRDRRRTLLELLKRGRVEFALACLKAAAPEEPWLRLLVQFLSCYTPEGREYLGLTAAECADACAARPETMAVLREMFAREAREAQSLAAAVELAEELAARGVAGAQSLLDKFFGEAVRYGLDSTDRMAPVGGFYLDRYLVTNRDYECMVPGHEKRRDQYSDTDDQPVIYVNWYEARLFCRWRGPGFRLPTEQEWECAASWDPVLAVKRKYPWGDEFDPARCNTSESGMRKTTPVGAYPDGVSACGCYDMAGNVWEWTESPWTENDESRVVRGGAWSYFRGGAACSYRSYDAPHLRGNDIGFRCART
jgi:formylglycine-generating enzyme required for sulfatase activity